MIKQCFLRKLENGKYAVVLEELEQGTKCEMHIQKQNIFLHGTIESNPKGEYYFLGENGKAYEIEDNMTLTYEF